MEKACFELDPCFLDAKFGTGGIMNYLGSKRWKAQEKHRKPCWVQSLAKSASFLTVAFFYIGTHCQDTRAKFSDIHVPWMVLSSIWQRNYRFKFTKLAFCSVTPRELEVKRISWLSGILQVDNLSTIARGSQPLRNAKYINLAFRGSW